MTRNRNLKAIIMLVAAFSVGAVVGGSLMEKVTRSIAEEEADERARGARALFNAFDHAVGHDEAIRLWRAELRRGQQPPREARSVEVPK